uniref:Uncharacterized protein n=1 Tax=Quercus lobata TaxID=97700 RepID=A0A7N2LZM5_QUELO
MCGNWKGNLKTGGQTERKEVLLEDHDPIWLIADIYATKKNWFWTLCLPKFYPKFSFDCLQKPSSSAPPSTRHGNHSSKAPPSFPTISATKNDHPLLHLRLCSENLTKAVESLRRDEVEKEVYALHWDDNKDFSEHARFDFPFHGQSINGVFHVVGTCNGLVCLANDLFR